MALPLELRGQLHTELEHARRPHPSNPVPAVFFIQRPIAVNDHLESSPHYIKAAASVLISQEMCTFLALALSTICVCM